MESRRGAGLAGRGRARARSWEPHVGWGRADVREPGRASQNKSQGRGDRGRGDSQVTEGAVSWGEMGQQ